MGDVLLVRLRNGDPFAGVCLNIRRRGIDTGVLLRGQLTRVGIEMWYKVYSPSVEGIEVVQRREKRARRARLYYMRWVAFLSWRVKGRGSCAGESLGFSGFWDFLLITLAGNLSTIWDRSRISCGSINARGLRWGREVVKAGMRLRRTIPRGAGNEIPKGSMYKMHGRSSWRWIGGLYNVYVIEGWFISAVYTY